MTAPVRITKGDAVEAPWDELRAFEDWQRGLGLRTFREVEMYPDLVLLLPTCPPSCPFCWPDDHALVLAHEFPPPIGEKWRGVA